jgi:hypothetical protein
MRVSILAAALLLAACASPGVSERLSPADSATEIITGGPLTMRVVSAAGGDGQDALVTMTLTAPDGRTMSFTEANHAPYDVMAQAAGGPLANVMGFFGEETPTLYSANEPTGAPFICAPEGPQMLGLHRAESGEIKIVGLKSGFEFEARDGGQYDPIPYSPDHVCARLSFRRG